MRRLLLTGGTGFIGGAILLELIARTDAEVHCLVREREGAGDPESRLAASLDHTTRAYGCESLLAEAKRRCRVLEGDITLAGCGVTRSRRPAVEEVWHTAASLAFEEEREAEIMRENVAGTEAVLELAGDAGADTFNHFSTAYVAGSHRGWIEEALQASDAETNNAYERSKVRGEHVVAGAPLERARIFRPSIVVGHSGTMAATSFTGLYGFVRNLIQLREEVGERLGGFLQHRALQLIGDASVPLNLIPVDAVAAAAVAVAASDSDERIFHLTNTIPVSVGEAMEVVSGAVGIRTPEWVADRDLLTSIDAEVDKRLVFYGSYLRNSKDFDRSHVDAAIDPRALDQPVVRDRLPDLVRWSVERLDPRLEVAPAASPS
jgi:nucleoside-diphosphate-sugar epimerase